eukprot:TRINITY_DN46842_c0_g1_i1.p2 TRINITY_DN46842_c0_g1~~TRINITY_DN46842_c0_g1_i1.p2  ORF type:complete len:157 (-),score=6.07 TRINITY_DN46842_c0_g1_i1:50-520(-)
MKDTTGTSDGVARATRSWTKKLDACSAGSRTPRSPSWRTLYQQCCCLRFLVAAVPSSSCADYAVDDEVHYLPPMHPVCRTSQDDGLGILEWPSSTTGSLFRSITVSRAKNVQNPLVYFPSIQRPVCRKTSARGSAQRETWWRPVVQHVCSNVWHDI